MDEILLKTVQSPPSANSHLLYTLEPSENRWGRGSISAWGGHRREGATILSDKVWRLHHFLYQATFIDWIVGGSQASDSAALIADGNLFHSSIRGKNRWSSKEAITYSDTRVRGGLLLLHLCSGGTGKGIAKRKKQCLQVLMVWKLRACLRNIYTIFSCQVGNVDLIPLSRTWNYS